MIGTANNVFHFFDTSIIYNLKIIEPSEKIIKKYLRKFNLLKIINQLPDGWHTNINYNNDIISNNIKAMLNIIRVLLKNPKIIIIDEVIDLINDKQLNTLLDYLSEIKHNHTIIITSNNPNIINGLANINM